MGGCTEAGGASGGWQQRHGWDGGIQLHTPRWRGSTLPPPTCQPPRLGASRSSDPADGWTGSGGGGGYTARGRHATAPSLACCCPGRDLDHPDPAPEPHEFPVCNITQESSPLSRIPLALNSHTMDGWSKERASDHDWVDEAAAGSRDRPCRAPPRPRGLPGGCGSSSQ